MMHAALSLAIDAARPDEIEPIRQRFHAALAAGQLSDDEATDLDARLTVNMRPANPFATVASLRNGPHRVRRASIFPPRPKARRPDPVRSVRRRRENAQCAVPAELAVSFTTGELSVLAIIVEEHRDHGRCDRSIAEIAARAGVCRSLVQRALKVASQLGYLTVTRRPVPGAKSLTNVVEIVYMKWLSWISAPTGSTDVTPTKRPSYTPRSRKPYRPQETSYDETRVPPERTRTIAGRARR